MVRNYLEGLIEDALANVLGVGPDKRKTTIRRARQYREGYQPKRLKVRVPASDDNIIVNFAGLVVERAVSLLFGDGVEFDLPGEGETPADEWLARVWELNKKDELLNDLADYGASSGTPTLLFDVDAIYADEITYPEIICLDPSYLTIKTDPENYRRIQHYEIKYQIPDPDKPDHPDHYRTRRRLIEPVYEVQDAPLPPRVVKWMISDFVLEGNKWVAVGAPKEWLYEWAPILPWKNLPNAGSPYGRPDLTDDVLDVQDAINLVASNINKVMRLQAHQRLWGRFLGGVKKAIASVTGQPTEQQTPEVMLGPDKVLNIENEHGHLAAIESSAGFEDMILFLHELRDSLFAIARSTDPHSLKDKIGQITNFGLRVMWKDGLDKLKTKRKLYGEALKETNRRLLELGGFEDTDPGKIVWPDALPEDDGEIVQGQKFELEAKLTSKQTIREERGRDNEVETERLKADAEEESAESANIGGALLKNFNRGQQRSR